MVNEERISREIGLFLRTCQKPLSDTKNFALTEDGLPGEAG
jgi:hypothetical protein